MRLGSGLLVGLAGEIITDLLNEIFWLSIVHSSSMHLMYYVLSRESTVNFIKFSASAFGLISKLSS